MKKSILHFLATTTIIALSLCTQCYAQYTKLIDLANANGNSPYGNLFSDGSFLYGMTYLGGANSFGTIFKIKPDGTGYTDLLDFSGAANGKYPRGSLISDGTFLYGMTQKGGLNDSGTVFKIKPDGTGYFKLLDLSTSKGGYPSSSLIFDGTFMYGTTSIGGTNNKGVLFKIKPDGTGYSKLIDFSGTTNGNGPGGSLFSDGTFLYGTTGSGGTNNKGVIFKIKPDGTGFSKLFDFAGSTNGSTPNGSLISDGTFMYGMTGSGGTSNSGVIFKIKPDGTGFSKLLDFAGATNGSYPRGSLIYDGTFLYGMANQGGTGSCFNGCGAIFKIKPDGTGYLKLLDFAGTSNGQFPWGSLISDGTFMYGMTCNGGAGTCSNGCGTVFKIKPDGTAYDLLHDFADNANGKGPSCSLFSDGTFMYGMTSRLGTNNIGVIFKIKPDGTSFSKLLNFDSLNGSYPYGSLISDGTFLYGMTKQGGTGACSGGCGTLFKIKPDGTGYNKLLDFVGTTNGSYPEGSLIFDGTFLYGMTGLGGANNYGVIFKIMPDGTGYTKLLDFTGTANGIAPRGSLIYDGTFLYGMTQYGGTGSCSSGCGVIFKIKPDGTGYSKLLDFTGTTNGSHPMGSLVFDGTFLYGTTFDGGSNNYGTIFKIKPDGTGYFKMLDFSGLTNGKLPYYGPLFSDGTFLFGMTYNGGTNDMGVLFKIKSDGTGFSKLLDFTGTLNGKWPLGSLVSDGIFLYGMTSQGGINDYGTLFKYQYCTPVTISGTDTTVCAGTSVTLTGNGATSYIWSGGIADGVGFIPTATTTYSVTGTGGNSCSNTATKTITVLPSASSSQAHIVCAGQSVTVGNSIYSTSGTYIDILTSYNGCDSTITTNLTVDSVNTSFTVSNATLTANATGASYQWINCTGNTLIAGATNQNYTATASGNYALIVTQNNCSDTSACYTINTISVTENNLANSINIYPNPFSSQTTITFDKEQKNIVIKITDEVGKQVKLFYFTGNKLIIEKEDLNAGTYFLEVKTEYGIALKKIIIN